MRRLILVVVLMVLPATFVSQKVGAKPPDDVETEIRNLELRRFQALTDADLPALEGLLSDDLVYTHASGWRQTKAEFLASIRSGELKYHSFTSDNFKMRVYGNTVLITGHAFAKVRAKGQELAVSLLYLEAYVKKDDRWQLVAWQSTRPAS